MYSILRSQRSKYCVANFWEECKQAIGNQSNKHGKNMNGKKISIATGSEKTVKGGELIRLFE